MNLSVYGNPKNTAENGQPLSLFNAISKVFMVCAFVDSNRIITLAILMSLLFPILLNSSLFMHYCCTRSLDWLGIIHRSSSEVLIPFNRSYYILLFFKFYNFINDRLLILSTSMLQESKLMSDRENAVEFVRHVMVDAVSSWY